MSDELLRFYNSELQHLRRQGDQFARANPQIASNLRIGTEGDYDPYVGRLVEAFAYLNARTRQKLEDGFPEIAGAYLDLLYPHYQRPVPSAMVAQFNLDEGQAELFTGYHVRRGTFVETPPADGIGCRFRTIYDTHCWPFTLHDVQLLGLPFRAPKAAFPLIAQGLLKIRLATQASHITFSSFQCESLRFHLRLPPPYCYQLYELLFDDVIGVALASGPDDPRAVFLQPDQIRAVGFGEQEGLVDYPSQSFLGYRLLSEFFSFPEKFLFFDLQFPRAALPATDQMEIYFYLRKRWTDLEPAIATDSLQLGCCPVVNLFQKRLEPIRLTHYQTEYPLVVDAQRREAYEVFSIDKVIGVDRGREGLTYEPFYSMSHAGGVDRYYWHASRRESEGRDELSHGTEMSIALVDLDFDPMAVENWRSTIHVEATCTNRNLPHRLPLVPGQTRLELDAAGAINHCLCLSKPSACQRPPLGQSRRWRLVSQLSLNHLSFTDSAQGAAVLKELLGLYAFKSSAASQAIIDGLRHIEAMPTVGRLPGDVSGALCRGMEIRVSFDDSKYTAGNLFLFATVLDHFFALFSNINSFTRTVGISTKRSGVFHQWPARAGQQSVL